MPSLADQYKQDERQRAKLRRQMHKESAELNARQMQDRLRRIQDISDEEWEAAVLASEGIAEQ